jgi:hypothetical protein
MEAGFKLSRRLVYRSFATFAVFLAGCFVPFAYPRFSHIPAVPVDNDHGNVHAFRVSADVQRIDFGNQTKYEIDEIPITPAGHIPAQNNLSLDRGCYVIGVALNYPVHRAHLIKLRLYRPGYQLVEFSSWQNSEKVTWFPASDLDSQEEAVDELLAAPVFGGYWNPVFQIERLKQMFDVSKTPPGSVSPHHRESLRFIAAEYERLAETNLPSADDCAIARDRLKSKASIVRDLAEK